MDTNQIARQQKSRLWCTVPLEVGDQIDLWHKKLGLQKTQFVSLCVQAGIKYIIRTMEPESAFTMEQWAKIAELAARSEVDEQEKSPKTP